MYLQSVMDAEELIQELLDNESPLFMAPQDTMDSSFAGVSNYSLISTFLYGHANQPLHDGRNSMLERDLMMSSRDHREGRYTLKIKTNCGNAMADDGYKWRKYGQKSIKNSPNPRSYYRCTNPKCGAKKQVERSSDEADTLIITYEGLHLHFAYPFLTLDQQESIDVPTKKQKKATIEVDPNQHDDEQTKEATYEINPGDININPTQITQQTEWDTQGLLEDVVPLVIRKPSTNCVTTSYSSSSSFPSPPTSPSCSTNNCFLSDFDA